VNLPKAIDSFCQTPAKYNPYLLSSRKNFQLSIHIDPMYWTPDRPLDDKS